MSGRIHQDVEGQDSNVMSRLYAHCVLAGHQGGMHTWGRCSARGNLLCAHAGMACCHALVSHAGPFYKGLLTHLASIAVCMAVSFGGRMS